MISTSGKIADKIAAKHAAANLAKPVVKTVKTGSKKLTQALKPKMSKMKKDNAKRTKMLDKKANPKSLAESKKKVHNLLKKLNLKSAGFGRYHKGKGQPVTHWAMRHPKSGLYLLADKKLHDTLVAKYGKKKVSVKPKSAKVAVKKKSGKILGRPSNARKTHEANKAEVTKLHLARQDKKRAEMLAKKGRKSDTPMSKKDQAKREAGVRKLQRTLDKHFYKK